MYDDIPRMSINLNFFLKENYFSDNSGKYANV